MTSAIFAAISNRFCSCGRASRSPQASRITNGAKPWQSASSAVARMQPEVEKPVISSVSTPAACKVEASDVPKKADGYCFDSTSSPAIGISVDGNTEKRPSAIRVPTLVLHGDDDQIMPIGDSSLLAVKLLKNGTLKTYPGDSRGMLTVNADVINADLLAFVEA